jgi:hypothetical protein
MAAGTATGNVAAATAVNSLGAEDATSETGAHVPAPERAEARPGTTHPEPAAFLPPGRTQLAVHPSPRPHSHVDDVMDRPSGDAGPADDDRPMPDRRYDATDAFDAAPLAPIEPEWVDGEEIYNVYRPAEDANDAV